MSFITIATTCFLAVTSQKSSSKQRREMLFSTLCLLAVVVGAKCCEPSPFTNITATVSGKEKENPKEVILSDCVGYNNETKNYFTIEVINQNIDKLLNGTFVDLPLQTLILTNNGIKEIESGSFQRLRRVYNVDLSKNNIKTIRNGVFNDLISLQTLSLSGNRVEEIEGLAFTYLVSLKEIKLDENKIKIWNTEWFSNNLKLHTLNLENNLLESLPDSAFSSLEQLGTLTLRNNRLKEIHQNVFNGLINLRYLDLSENKLTNLHKDIFAPIALRKINEVNTVSDSNAFSIVIPNFQPFNGLWSLYIHRNNLTFLADDIMNDLTRHPPFKLITLYGNPWQCSCYKKIVKWTDENRLQFNTWGKGCRHPKNPVCITTKKNSNECVEEPEEDIRSLFYSLYKHYTFYDGTDVDVRCNYV